MKRPSSLSRSGPEARYIFTCFAFGLLPYCSAAAVAAGSNREARLRGSAAAAANSTEPNMRGIFQMLLSEVKDVEKRQEVSKERQDVMSAKLKKHREESERKQKELLREQKERHRLQAELEEKRRAEYKHQRDQEAEERTRQWEEERKKDEAYDKAMMAKMKNFETGIRDKMKAELSYAHHHIEDDLGGWQTAESSWRDLYQKSDLGKLWRLLSAEAISESLRAAGLSSESRVLIVEPKTLGLAHQFAQSIARRSSGATVHSAELGAEPVGPYDLVIELGVLDDIAMGSRPLSLNATDPNSRPALLRDAVSRITNLLVPGGAWIEVSSVPAVLRVPLLEKLNERNSTGVKFNPMDPEHDVQRIVVNRNATEDDELLFKDRGVFFADMLLNGDTSLHVFSYMLRRISEPVAPETDTLEPSLLSQFLAAVDELVQQQRPFEGNVKDDL